jgi:hypothetical protein
MGRNFALTLPQIREAVQMYGKGNSLGDLERHFGCSRTAIRNALRLAGVKLRERKHAVQVALLRRFIEKPAPARRGWTWMNQANAEQWQIEEKKRA